MRALAFAVLAFALGLLLGFLLFDTQQRVQRTPAASPREEPEPPKPQQAPDDRTVNRLKEEIRERDARIRELTRKLDAAKKAPPPAALLRDLEQATVEQLQDMVEACRLVGQERLLAVPDHVLARHAALLRRNEAGAARILPRGEYVDVVAERGGGAYFSFATRENDYDEEPDLQLQHGYYLTSFYGGTFGFFLDLGPLPLADVPADANSSPSTVPAEQAGVWSFFWEDPPPDRKERRAYEKRGKDLGLRDRVKAKPEHTYLLRSVLPGEHDILVAFRQVHRDDHGHSLVFRELKRWDCPR